MNHFTLAYIRGKTRVLPVQAADLSVFDEEGGYIFNTWQSAAEKAFAFNGSAPTSDGLFQLPGRNITYLKKSAELLEKAAV